MNVLTYFEQLANNTHHRINSAQLLASLPADIQHAIATNDATSLKKQLGDTKQLADRSTIFQL